MNICVAGENSLIIYFGEETTPEVSARVQRAVHLLQQSMSDVLVDLIPSYASLLVIYDLFRTDIHTIRPKIRALLTDIEQIKPRDGRLVELPVYYGAESGPDLASIADKAGLTTEQVIEIHQSVDYQVYAIGFAPGFAYLGEVDSRIATPRLPTPRKMVPRGAVGIADRQTAVYPAASPGGWNIIGLCPQRMFDLTATPTMPVNVGDRIRFRQIDRESFIALGGAL